MIRARAAAQRRPREERVAEIMAAAAAEFRRVGFEKASMARIARQANVVEGSIYRFFASKHDLLLKVVEAWYEEMLADYARELSVIRGTRARLRYMIWRHVSTLRDDALMCRLMFEHVRAAPDYRASAVFRLNHLYTVRTIEIVEEGIARGELRPDVNLRLLRDLIYGGVEHRSWAWLRGEGELDVEGTADAVVDLVFHGLAVREGGADGAVALRLERIATRLEAAVADADRIAGEDRR